jgi:hypothetical protein
MLIPSPAQRPTTTTYSHLTDPCQHLHRITFPPLFADEAFPDGGAGENHSGQDTFTIPNDDGDDSDDIADGEVGVGGVAGGAPKGGAPEYDSDSDSDAGQSVALRASFMVLKSTLNSTPCTLPLTMNP